LVSNHVEVLDGFPFLTTLNIAKNKISDKGAKALAKKGLISLDVSGNHIKKEGIEALVMNPTFTYLNIGNNPESYYADQPLREVLNQKIAQVKGYPKLRTVSLFSSNENPVAGIFPLELEKLILDYCEPSPFICRNVYDPLTIGVEI
jgi:hypothetical protein